MRKIAAIETQKKNPSRVSICLDDEYAFGLARIVAAWLQVGQVLSDEKIADLQMQDARETAYQTAMRFLSYRPRSTSEVKKNLEKHKIPAAVIEETLKRLENVGLLNDQEFAGAWVENRSIFRPRSRRALALELRQKGLSEDVVQQALSDIDEEKLALEAARKRARRLQGLEWPDFRRKLGEFLGRRGFAYGVVAPLVRQVWVETHPDGDESTFDDEEIS